MKIIIELDVIQETDGLNDKLKLENTEAIIKKHFNNQCNLIDNKPTYFRNLGNIWGNADLIVKLSKTETLPSVGADITNITVNRVELASNLAHNAAKDEMLINGSVGDKGINDEDEMFIYDEEGNTSYTDDAQEVFNTWYDYFYDEIGKAATK